MLQHVRGVQTLKMKTTRWTARVVPAVVELSTHIYKLVAGSAPSSRKNSTASVGPQYRYIDGERYVREDCLYSNTDEEYQGTRRRTAGHHHPLPEHPQGRHYQTYNYLALDEKNEDLYNHHQVTNRRRSEPVHGMHWRQSGLPRNNVVEDMDEVFTYQVRLNSSILLG